MTPTYPTIDQSMTRALNDILMHGTISSPRGKRIKEILSYSISFNMFYPIVTKPSREIGYRFYCAEAAWILSGRNDLEFFRALGMPFIWEFSDDGFFYQGAYGPRVVEQLSYVCDLLAEDPDTRQAVMTIWRPNPRPSRDIPCTVAYQFLARDGMLHCIQTMRSSDAWLGYPYDAFNATMLTLYVILLLRNREKRSRHNLSLGMHTLFAGSMHLYEKNWANAERFVEDRDTFSYELGMRFKMDHPSRLLQQLVVGAQHADGVNPRARGWELLGGDAT